jgi:hypothetical protein
MKTIFEMGFSHTRRWLGQDGGVTVMQEERERIVNQINSSLAAARTLEDLIAWSVNNDPELRRTLGADASRFWALSDSIAPLYQTSVAPVLERMSDPDPEFWIVPTDQEAQDIRTWTTGVAEMVRIVALHPALPQAAPLPGAPPPPPGAAPRPDLPRTPAPAPQATILGLPQDQLLIAGGIAVAAGILIYALA